MKGALRAGSEAHGVQGRAAHCMLLFLLLAEQPCSSAAVQPDPKGCIEALAPLGSTANLCPSAGVSTAGTVCHKLSRSSRFPALLF